MNLVAGDFSYTESTKELTLSYSGRNKISSASLTAKQKYQYTITFKFTDYSSVDTTDTKTLDVKVNLIKAQMITQKDIENMMKSVNYKEGGLLLGGTPNAGDIIIGDGTATKFSFASANFSSSSPNFSATGTTTTSSSSATIATSKAAETLADAINDNAEFGKYFSNFLGVESSATPKISGKDCTFTLKFKTLKSGHALSSEVAHLTTTGLTIKLTLDSKANWQ